MDIPAGGAEPTPDSLPRQRNRPRGQGGPRQGKLPGIPEVSEESAQANPLALTNEIVPQGMEQGSLSNATSWQVFVCAAVEQTPVCKGDGFWISVPAGCGKTTLLKLILCRYPDQVTVLANVGSQTQFDDPHVINYHGEPLLIILDEVIPDMESEANYAREAFTSFLVRLTDGDHFEYTSGARTYRVSPHCKVLIITTKSLPDVPDLRQRFKQIAVTEQGSFYVQQRTKVQPQFSNISLAPRHGLVPAMIELLKRFQEEDIEGWLPSLSQVSSPIPLLQLELPAPMWERPLALMDSALNLPEPASDETPQLETPQLEPLDTLSLVPCGPSAPYPEMQSARAGSWHLPCECLQSSATKAAEHGVLARSVVHSCGSWDKGLVPKRWNKLTIKDVGVQCRHSEPSGL